jgi:hypothetical protein
MSLLFFGLAIAAALCMAHAATRKRWEVVKGGAPIAAALLVVALIFEAH